MTPIIEKGDSPDRVRTLLAGYNRLSYGLIRPLTMQCQLAA